MCDTPTPAASSRHAASCAPVPAAATMPTGPERTTFAKPSPTPPSIAVPQPGPITSRPRSAPRRLSATSSATDDVVGEEEHVHARGQRPVRLEHRVLARHRDQRDVRAVEPPRGGAQRARRRAAAARARVAARRRASSRSAASSAPSAVAPASTAITSRPGRRRRGAERSSASRLAGVPVSDLARRARRPAPRTACGDLHQPHAVDVAVAHHAHAPSSCGPRTALARSVGHDPRAVRRRRRGGEPAGRGDHRAPAAAPRRSAPPTRSSGPCCRPGTRRSASAAQSRRTP